MVRNMKTSLQRVNFILHCSSTIDTFGSANSPKVLPVFWLFASFFVKILNMNILCSIEYWFS